MRTYVSVMVRSTGFRGVKVIRVAASAYVAIRLLWTLLYIAAMARALTPQMHQWGELK